MYRNVIAGLSMVLLMAGSGAGKAQTLTQRQTMAFEDPRLSKAAMDANAVCGTAITAGFDWQSFLKAGQVGDKDALVYKNSPSEMCSVPLSDIQSMCGDPLAKQAIASKIKSFQCVYQGGPTPTLSLDSAGRLQLRSSFDAYHHMDHTTLQEFARDWLRQHL